MASGGRSKNHPRSIRRAQQMARALDLKLAGLSIRKIATKLRVSVTTAHELVDEGRKGIPAEARDALVAEIHERELAIVAAHWSKRAEPEHARVIQASDQFLARLLGLEAPKRTEHTGADGAPIVFDLNGFTTDQIAAVLAATDALHEEGAPHADAGGVGAAEVGDSEPTEPG